MRGTFNGNISFRAGEELKEGMAVHIDWATRTVKKAFDEDVEIAMVLNSVEEGDAVTVARKNLNGTYMGILKDTGIKGGSVYLDIQADQESATGLLKFTAGTATVELFVTDMAVTLANSLIPVAWL